MNLNGDKRKIIPNIFGTPYAAVNKIKKRGKKNEKENWRGKKKNREKFRKENERF